jgi:uncharacterized protein (TIGR02597 family)
MLPLSRAGVLSVVCAALFCAAAAFSQTVDSSSVSNKFILGYQGWHMCQGDGNPVGGYIHWSGNGGVPSTTNGCVDDIWPDLSEFTAGELFATGFTLGNGQAAKVYSDYLPQTCNRHFAWMQTNGIDGVFAQRFTKDVFQDANWTKLKNQVMSNVMNAAQSYGRVFCVEYDISNDPTNVAISHLTSDWAFLSGTMKITNSSRYLKHRGKPLVAVYGLGFISSPSPGAEYSPGQALTIISNFHAAGCSVMGGVPYNWHILTNDALPDTNWLTVYKSFDIISPWAVGRYVNTNQIDSFKNSVIAPDLTYCNANGMDYMPVILPGYSAANLGGGVSNGIARLGGKFYWRQAYDCLSAGCNMLFGAMFDEIDEGTAIYKLAPTQSTIPQFQNMFALNVDGYTLPSDWYLRVAGAITKTVHKQNPLNEPLPISATNSITLLSPIGGETWRVGSKALVTWSSTGVLNTVKVDLSTDGGNTWSSLAYGISNSGLATVLVPNLPSTTCWVRVADLNGTPTDWSETNFTISATPVFRPSHLQPLWNLAPGSRTYLPADTSLSGSTPLYRSIAYNGLSNQVVIVSRTGPTTGLTANVIDATTGADLYSMNTSGISGGNIVLLSAAAADDGAIYAANMSSSGTGVATYKLYRWPSSAAGVAPTLVFSGEPASRTDAVRWGDTLAVQGTGTNTQILIDCQSTNVCALLMPNNGNMNSWTSISGPQDYTGVIGRSLQFGPSNTFWQKRKADRLEMSTFSTTSSPGSLTTSNAATYSFLPNSVGPVGIDFSRNLLAALNFSGVTSGADALDLYDISNLSSPTLLSSYDFPTNQQPNPNWIGQIVFGGGKVFAVDGNNGIIAFSEVAGTQPDMRFDIGTFCCPCSTDDHYCFPQFDHLNWVSTNGHYLCLGTDAYRTNVEANGNVLAAYYDTFTTSFSTNTAQQKADSINQYVTNLFTSYGPRPDWVVLNEISSSQWPNNDSYRQWTTNVVHILATQYGYNVIIYSPFPNPGTANAAYWRAIANDGYIGVENYLSGQEIKNQNFSVPWCQSQYQISTNNYGACGVPLSRLILGEHFACNTFTNSDGTTNNWGRAGVSYDDWEKALIARSKAALNIGFPGFASYAWAKNGMLVSDSELIHFEDVYRTNFLPATLATAPVALVNGPNATNTLGSTATFSVAVTGTTPINFQWQHNGVNLADGGNIAGALSSSVTITGLQASDGGTYTAQVGNAANSIQSNATLTMLLPPTITTQPADTAVLAGGTAVLNVAVSGTAPFNYRWRKAGVPLNDGGNIFGTLTSTLTVSNVQNSDVSSYSVVITNNYGTATSSNAVLSIQTPITITVQPSSQTANYATNVVFSVAVTGGGPVYQWQRNSTPLSDSSHIAGSSTANLTVINLTTADQASYRVVVTNLVSAATSTSATLAVLDPAITSQPQSTNVSYGNTALLQVAAAGSPTLAYQWQKNSTNIANGGSISGATTSALTISQATNSDSGTYTVRVSNSVSNMTSAPAIVSVFQAPPTLTGQPLSRTNNAGTVATFTVTANGPSLSYQWYKGATPLTDTNNISGSGTSTLNVSSVLLADEGTYSVVVTNPVGSVTSSNATLSVVYPMPYYEPFVYSSGAVLGQQTNPNLLLWTEVGTNTAGSSVTVQSGNLNYSGLPPSVGNDVQFGGLAKSARLSFPTGRPITNGTVYYSHLFRVTNTNGLSTSGVFISGFNNSTGSQGTTPSVVGTRIYIRSVAGGYNIGVAKNDSTPANWVWDSRTWTTNDTLYLVGSYTFGTVALTTDDVCKLWINPTAAELGAASPTTTPLVASLGLDISSDQIASFVILQRSASEPAAMLIDEIRMDTTWAGVTGKSAPIIITPPISQEVFAGSNVTFNALASGTIPLSYQWQFNGGNISTATNSVLTKATVSAADAGNYAVVVSNSVGGVTSAVARLIVDVPPTITQQPQSQTVNGGNNVTFNVAAFGTAPLTYQWKKNGSIINGATDPALTLPSIGASDAASYSVVITNIAGAITSSDAVLTVMLTPQLLSMAANADNTFGLVWSVSTGTTYHFQSADSISNAQWSTISDYTAASNTLAVVDGPLTNTIRFYRLSSIQASSAPAGFLRISALGNSDTFVSLPFARPGVISATVATASGNLITATGSPNWTPNQFVYAPGTQSNTYYVRLTSGSAEGRIYPITANDATSLTVNLGADTLNNINFGDSLVIEAYWTLNTVFPNGYGINVSPTVGNRNTEILIPDLTSVGINLSASKIYFFNAGIWKQVGQGNNNHNDDVLSPNAFFVIRHNVATNTVMSAPGNVVTSKVVTLVQTVATNKQDNSVGLMRPLPISLNNSGLISSGAFSASPLPGTRTDELLTFDNTSTNRNKSASAVYYYWNGAWRLVGAGSTDVGTNQVLGAGGGVIVRKSTNGASVLWTNAPNY